MRAAQRLDRVRIIHLQPREHAGDGVAALEALFLPVRLVAISAGREVGQRDFLDHLGNNRLFGDGTGRDPKSGKHADKGQYSGQDQPAYLVVMSQPQQVLR